MAQASSVLTPEEIGQRGRALYDRKIREKVETEENIGKIVVMDIETGDYEVDETGIDTALRLQSRHPNAVLYAMRIGYNAVDALGGILERTSR